jgi:diphthamide biosynthesis protein 7
MESIKSLISFKLDLPPSCIEFFPLKPEFAVIGTYNLEKKEDSAESSPKQESGKSPQQRNGSLVLVRIEGDNVYVLISPKKKTSLINEIDSLIFLYLNAGC